jgi:hypothetical protein
VTWAEAGPLGFLLWTLYARTIIPEHRMDSAWIGLSWERMPMTPYELAATLERWRMTWGQ